MFTHSWAMVVIKLTSKFLIKLIPSLTLLQIQLNLIKQSHALLRNSKKQDRCLVW